MGPQKFFRWLALENVFLRSTITATILITFYL